LLKIRLEGHKIEVGREGEREKENRPPITRRSRDTGPKR